MDTLEELISDAFVAGFMVSGEGYNGEYPFYMDRDIIRLALAETIQEHLAGSVVGAHRSAIIRELIEKALGSEADDYRSYDGYVAEWLKDQLKGE